jgi:hypothetical protein
LSTREKERYEKLQELLAKLSDEAAKVCLVLVEGKKDAHALAELGICGHILAVKAGGKSSFDVLQQIEAMHPCGGYFAALIMIRPRTRMYPMFQRELERLKIKVNVRFWIEIACVGGAMRFNASKDYCLFSDFTAKGPDGSRYLIVLGCVCCSHTRLPPLYIKNQPGFKTAVSKKAGRLFIGGKIRGFKPVVSESS